MIAAAVSCWTQYITGDKDNVFLAIDEYAGTFLKKIWKHEPLNRQKKVLQLLYKI